MKSRQAGITLFLYLAMIGTDAFGDNPCADSPQPPLPTTDISKLADAVAEEELEWWSATPEQIRNAPCRRTWPFSDAEIEDGIQALLPARDKKISKNVHGLQLENESAYLIDLLETLLTRKEPFGGLDKKNQQIFKSSCKTVSCVVQDPSIFGPKLGPRLLFMLGRYGFNGSPYATFNSDNWTDNEIDDVLISLSDFPPTVLPVEKSKQLTHFKRGKGMAVYGKEKGKRAVANAFIFIFDSWNNQVQQHRQSTITHEIGHYFASHYDDLDESSPWLKFAKWSERTVINNGVEETEPRLGNPRATVSKYGQTNPSEDFAESVVAYRYNPQLLLSRSPEKYRFLKETVFDGVEYVSADTCDPATAKAKAYSTSLSDQARADSDVALNDDNKLAKWASRVNLLCGQSAFDQFSKEATLSSQQLARADACINRAIMGESLAETPQMKNLKYKSQAKGPALSRIKGVSPNPKVTAKVRDKVLNQIEGAFSEFMLAQDGYTTKYRYAEHFPPKSGEEFCKDYSNFAYQRAETALDSKFGNDIFFSFNNKSLLNGFAYQVCLDLQKGKRKIVQPTRAEITAAVKRRFSR